MRIWYDACTGKHVRYGVAIAKKLREAGHEVVLTTRKHPDTIPLVRFLNENFIVVGRYDPKSLLSRLREGIKRQLLFCKIFGTATPDIAVSHCSVDQMRVAFGLKIPTVATFDTPYAEAVNRLTLPLADSLIASKAIPEKILRRYNSRGRIIQFEGVDEVAWIKNYKPLIKYNFGKPLIVVREVEEKAAYAGKAFSLIALAKKLTKIGNVVFLTRYRRRTIKGLIVPTDFVDSASLVAQADLFVGVGGTITREAALQGTPAIVVNVFGEQYVNHYLTLKGFPIFTVRINEVLDCAKRLLEKRWDVKDLLNQLENPVDVVEQVIREKLTVKGVKP